MKKTIKMIYVLEFFTLFFIIPISSYQVSSLSDSEDILYSQQQINYYASNDILDISFIVDTGDLVSKDTISIINVEVALKANPTIKITNDSAQIYKYHIKDVNFQTIRSGNLTWDATRNEWKKDDIPLAWTGGGDFYITLEFKIESMTESQETEIIDDVLHSYFRNNAVEIVILVVIIVSIALGITAVIVFIYLRKSTAAVERKTKEKEKEIKIKEIKKSELMEAKEKETVELAKKEEKGKTKASEDLIFSVPKWDEGDLEGDSDED